MSWEGYHQSICVNGHQFDHGDDYDDRGGYAKSKCHICRGDSVWSNTVDDTNCDAHGTIRDFTPVMIKPEETKVCNLGHIHVIEHATYRVPQKNELERWWKNWEKDYAWDKLPPKE